MINLDQVRTLEWKVKQAVQLIVQLRRENDTLKGRLTDTEVRLRELETLLEAVKATQSEMESGIQNALVELDLLEEDEPSLQAQPHGEEPVATPVEVTSAPSLVIAPVPEPEVEAEPEVESALSETIAAVEEEADAAFEAEFAALAAAEAAALEDEASSVLELPVPPSVELEAPEEAASPDKPGEPEQPGLGIF